MDNGQITTANRRRLTHLTKLFKEVDENKKYLEVKLVNFEIHKKSVSAS